MPIGLIALALGGFGIGLTEFVIMGLLPEVAADFRVTEATAGWLISGYALAVVVGALLLTAAVTRFERKPVLAVLMVLFIAGNLVSAIAPDYALMMVGRIIAALAHGAFFGIGAVVAASMVAPTKKAGAIAIMFTGLTAANVLGVPFGTMLGQAAGWRSTFWAITGIGVLALVGILALVPKTGSGEAAGLPQAGCAGELRAFRSGQVWLSILVTILGYGGMFGAFTYIAFTLTEVTGFSAATVPWLLILFGVGLFIGNTVGGKAADRNVDRTLLVVLAALVVVLVVFALTAGQPADDHRLHGAAGRLRLRHRPRPADARHEVRRQRAHARLRRQHRRLQRRQRPRRLAGRRDHHRRTRLHLADLGGRRNHAAGLRRDGLRRCRGQRRAPGRAGAAGERTPAAPDCPHGDDAEPAAAAELVAAGRGAAGACRQRCRQTATNARNGASRSAAGKLRGLRVPLHRGHPALRVFQRLDRPVVGDRRHHQAVAHPGHGLVVAGGNLDRHRCRRAPARVQPGHLGAGGDRRPRARPTGPAPWTGDGLAVRHRARIHVLDQGSAVEHVQELVPAADAQHRQRRRRWTAGPRPGPGRPGRGLTS